MLAIIDRMLDVFRMDLGLGYDIGCHTETTVDKSPLGERAHEMTTNALLVLSMDMPTTDSAKQNS